MLLSFIEPSSQHAVPIGWPVNEWTERQLTTRRLTLMLKMVQHNRRFHHPPSKGLSALHGITLGLSVISITCRS